MEISESIQHLESSFSNVKDWDKNNFSHDKAFICGIISNLAYCHLSDFEFKSNDYVNLIPSDAFYAIRKGEQSNFLTTLLENLDAEEPIIIERAGSVVVAIKYQDVIFVSMRGTENFRDWRVNLNFRKIEPSRYVRSDLKAKLHKGFYFEVDSFLSELMKEIIDRGWSDRKIYITGHSLGGALAAITYALRTNGFHHFYDEHLYSTEIFPNIISCYTFGMPRWGNEKAIEYFKSPYHIFVSNDIVPSIPPKFLGFDDCKTNFNLEDHAFNYISFDDGSLKSLIKGIKSFLTLKKLEDHRIENYVENLFNKIKN